MLAKFVSLRALDSRYLLSEGCPQLAIVCLPSASCHKDLSTWPLSSNAAREKKVHQPDGLISCKAILVKTYHYLCHILLFRSISQVLLIPGGGGEWVLHNGMNTRRQGWWRVKLASDHHRSRGTTSKGPHPYTLTWFDVKIFGLWANTVKGWDS